MSGKKFLLHLIIFLSGISTVLSQDLADKFRDHVQFLSADSLEGRGVGTRGKEIARDYIVNQFSEAGLKSFEGGYISGFDFRKDLIWAKGENVAGYLEGSDPGLKDEYILIGAHYDHLGYERKAGTKIIYPGADDNASGVAAIIEMARHFAGNREQLGRSLIVVAFDAEESGLIGSYKFVDQSPVDLSKIKLMFSFDMVGMYEANQGMDLRGIGTLSGGLDLAQSIAREISLNINNKGNSVPMGTDTYPFGTRGIPSIHVFTSIKSPYHKPEDKYDLLDYEGMAKIHSFSTEFISRCSKLPFIKPSEEMKTFAVNNPEPKAVKIKSGFVFNSGTGYHNYKGDFYKAKPVYDFGAGIFSSITIKNFIRFEPAVLYDFNGSRIQGGSFRRHSVTVPLNAGIFLPVYMGFDGGFYVFGGGYYRYNLAADSASVKLDFTGQAERTEWGYSFGFKMELSKFIIGYTARRGITGVFKQDDPEIIQNSNYLTFGIKF